MTFPVLQATARGASAAPATSHNVTLPATVNAGDLLFARIGNTGGVLSWDNATVGAWQQLHTSVFSTRRLSAFWKIADGSEDGATLTVGLAASGHVAWHIDRFSGAASVEAATAVGGNGATFNPPALNPSWGTEDVHWVVGLAGLHPGGPTGSPANYGGQIHDISGGGSGGVGIDSWYRQLNAESQDPGSADTNPTGQAWVVNTYAVRAGATLFPPRLDVGVTFFAPSVRYLIAPPRLDAGVQFFAPRVASLQVLAPPRLDVAVTLFAPFVGAGLLPLRLDVGVTFFAPTILKPGTLEPPRLDVGVKFFPPLVEGGFRVVPQFTSLSFGPFPGAIGDAVLLTGGPGAALKFENRWNVRGPIGFTDFAPFVAGSYEFNAAYVWLRLRLDAPSAFDIAINRALMHIDVPDAIDRGFADIPVNGAWVNFGRTFNVPPEVVAQVVTAIGITDAPKVTVRDDVETGRFFAVCHTGDTTTTSVAARIKYVAAGY